MQLLLYFEVRRSGMLVNAAQGYLKNSKHTVHIQLLLDFEVRRSGMLANAAQGHLEAHCSHAVASRHLRKADAFGQPTLIVGSGDKSI